MNIKKKIDSIVIVGGNVQYWSTKTYRKQIVAECGVSSFEDLVVAKINEIIDHINSKGDCGCP